MILPQKKEQKKKNVLKMYSDVDIENITKGRLTSGSEMPTACKDVILKKICYCERTKGAL